MVIKHLKRFRNGIRKRFRSIANAVFRKKKDIKIGLYGPVNSGKTTLANRICIDWLGEELGKASIVPHETREIQMKESVTIKDNGKGFPDKFIIEDEAFSGLKLVQFLVEYQLKGEVKFFNEQGGVVQVSFPA